MPEKSTPPIPFFKGLLLGVLLTFVLLRIIPIIQSRFFNRPRGITQNAQVLASPTLDTTEITKNVLPSEATLGVTFGDAVVKMVQSGAIDRNKFLALYEGRGGLPQKEKQLLDTATSEKIIISPDNAQILLNLLWPLGISNKTNVLSDGPIGTQYKSEVGNFASTGGWTLGKVPGGQLFNKYELVKLTSEQEKTVTEIAQNIYRPCCGNSTYFPDCNHGAAMLGFLYLAVTQGMPTDEIYKEALILNSYWFPQTYSDLAVYFQTQKKIAWKDVNPREVLGQNYSSSQGYKAISQELENLGLLPKVAGGGGCGV